MEDIKNILTIDVEEYFHAENILCSLSKGVIDGMESRIGTTTHRILDLLGRYGSRATFFILGCVAERDRGLIKDIARAGHEVASHGYQHIPLYRHSRQTFEVDLERSIDILSDIIGAKVIGYRATSFSYSDDIEWFGEALIKFGIAYDSSIAPSLFRRSCDRSLLSTACHFTIKGDLKEFPVSSMKVGAIKIPLGGGYFRALPYAVTAWGMNQVRTRGAGIPIFYTHPWELDPGQPRLNIAPLKYIRHYIGLCKAERKFDRLLKDNVFSSIKDHLDASK